LKSSPFLNLKNINIMEVIEVSQEAYDSLDTNTEILDNAIGDRRKVRLRGRAEAARKAAASGKKLRGRAKRDVKRMKRKPGVFKKKIARVGKRQKFRKKVGTGIKKIAGLSVLGPLMPVMAAALRKKGVATKKMGLAEMTKQFYNKIVKPQSGNTYETLDFDPEVDYIDPVTVTALVSAVIGFIKRLKKKKQEGAKLTPTQEKIVEGSDKVIEEIKYESEVQGAEKMGRAIFMDNKVLILVAVAVVALLLLKK
jgi:hypothetical protein